MTTPETIQTIKQGAIGGGATGAGLGISSIEQINEYLQLGSRAVGLLVGLISLYNLTIGKRRKGKKDKK